jgi:phosphatidylglycerophosphatase A
MSDTRKLDWKKVEKNPKLMFALFTATAGGAGLLPKAPGTFGAMVGVLIAYFTADWSLDSRVSLWTFLIVIGIWSAKIFDQTMKTSDNQNIVIDEVVGLGVTAWTVGADPLGLLIAFLLFRFFDVLKPFPVRQIDRWSKKKAKSTGGTDLGYWWSGFGVVADDLVAGVQGLIIILLLQHFQILS